MNIDFVWYFDKAEWVYPKWRDGLRAAMEIIGKDHNVRWHLGTDVSIPDDSDFILNWDNSTSEFIPQMSKYNVRKGLILTTDLGLNIEALRAYDVVFPEALPVINKIRPHGIRVIKAFGTDDNFFSPMDVKKEYEAFYPATFSPWKRQNLFADKYGDRGLLLGTVQPDGYDILKHCIDRKTNIMLGYYEVDFIKELFNKSEKVDITGWEGSGRTVLEALSCGIEVEVDPENHKAHSYITEWKSSGLSPREFIQQYYSAQNYASLILKGIRSLGV